MNELFTEGARRVLQRAADLATASGMPATEPSHLLRALLEDESRAAELAEAEGLTASALQTFLAKGDFAAADGSEAVETVIVEARRQMTLSGNQTELGTEHLLFGLTMVESRVSPLLIRHGLTAGTLAQRVMEASGVPSQPIDVEVRLQWDDQTAAERVDMLRILDAAANRAREGLRVIEDYVRFGLDDAHLSRRLKDCRHRIARILDALPAVELLRARDTLADVGTEISTPTEQLRSSARHVLTANFKRTQEALRTLEEFTKVVSPQAGSTLGQLRYELYTLEKAVLLLGAGSETFEDRLLYVLVTESLCHHGSGPAVRGALEAGAGVVQIREKSMPDRELIEHAERVRAWTREFGALLIINDRPDIAALVEADGVHVGQDELTVRQARRILGPSGLVGVSTHTIEQARQAVLDGADYLGVGPTFPSGTKAFDTFAGLDFVREVAAEIALPWFAIGGIAAGNVEQVIDAGARRVAVSGAVCGAEKPRDVARTLLDALRATSP